MNAMAKTLASKGVSGDKIVTEAFSQGSHRQTGKIFGWPVNIYALGAVGVGLGSLAVMVSDLLTNLPKEPLLGKSSLIDSTNSTNSRQDELDNLVNGLPARSAGAPATNLARQAVKQKNTTQTSSVSAATTGTVYVAPIAPTTTRPTPTTTVTPTPTVKCTTTQSGVKTCV